MSKRGLSVEEKRKRMLDWFFETQDFYQLKDVEKLCATEKGITVNTIKDILTSLVDDGLVDSEKIGTSLYYWALPSKNLKTRQETLKKLEKELQEEKEKNERLKQNLESSKSNPDDPERRAELLEQIQHLSQMQKKLEKELEEYKENDPEVYKEKRAEIEMCKKACNRWIDNIFSLKSYLKRKFNVDNSVIDKQFEIPTELDYY